MRLALAALCLLAVGFLSGCWVTDLKVQACREKCNPERVLFYFPDIGHVADCECIDGTRIELPE